MLLVAGQVSLERADVKVTEQSVFLNASIWISLLVAFYLGRNILVLIPQANDALSSNDPDSAETGAIINGKSAMHPFAFAFALRRADCGRGRSHCEC